MKISLIACIVYYLYYSGMTFKKVVLLIPSFWLLVTEFEFILMIHVERTNKCKKEN